MASWSGLRAAEEGRRKTPQRKGAWGFAPTGVIITMSSSVRHCSAKPKLSLLFDLDGYLGVDGGVCAGGRDGRVPSFLLLPTLIAEVLPYSDTRDQLCVRRRLVQSRKRCILLVLVLRGRGSGRSRECPQTLVEAVCILCARKTTVRCAIESKSMWCGASPSPSESEESCPSESESSHSPST